MTVASEALGTMLWTHTCPRLLRGSATPECWTCNLLTC